MNLQEKLGKLGSLFRETNKSKGLTHTPTKEDPTWFSHLPQYDQERLTGIDNPHRKATMQRRRGRG